jgi:hypothetical protein
MLTRQNYKPACQPCVALLLSIQAIQNDHDRSFGQFCLTCGILKPGALGGVQALVLVDILQVYV